MMHKEDLINPAAQSERGSTFAGQLGSGMIGTMGTGNFNLSLLQQNPDLFDNVGVTFSPVSTRARRRRSPAGIS